ncbi:nSTAND1 domain-containing NTPase [Streptomyces sp. 4N124]|uniref:nSTAND1 domain-containing NTPase n=1 Tax=Streptomyces sp. 4N124 TaxID=3457420 RepID=UPI003FD1D9B6
MTLPSDDELTRGIARFWNGDGEVTGSGFLIAERTLCTCAHVVANALGTSDTDPAPPAAPVTLDFPLLTPPSARLTATVTHWRPVAGDGGGDIALLALEAIVPGTTPVRFAGGTAVWDHRFRVLGFPLRSDDHGLWAHGRLRAPVGRGWTSMEPTESRRGLPVGQGFSGAPVWDIEQGGVVGMTVAADVGSGATTAYLIPTALLLGLEPAHLACPFRGLESFREEDAGVFFARRAESERIAEALRAHPFVPVAGASGVGKSSLVRAGVLPLLRSAGHTVTDFAGQPDTDPVRTLAEAVGGQFPPARDLAQRLGRDPETATLLGARILELAGTAGHVILLDQFEETVGARPSDARALLDVLLPMARAAHPAGRRLRVLATLRSASLEELVTGGHAEALSGTVQMVAPMTPAQLDEVVRRPIDAIPGVEFEPGLPELLVSDAGGEPGALPLVEFALAELWDRRQHGRLTHAAYREIGGVEGALSRYADQQLAQVCKTPDGPDETTARRLFERLARPVGGKEYARVARAFGQLPPELRAAAQALAGTRLLVISCDSSGKETVALAHEALVRKWPTLRGWLDESRAFLAWHEKLRGRLREWEDSGRHNDLLLRGQELTAAKTRAAQRPAELSTEESEFIRLSRQHHRRSVRRGRTAITLVSCLVALVAGLSLVSFVLIQGGKENDQREAARRLAGYAESRAAKDPVAAALLALSARRTSDVPEARQAVTRTALPLSRATRVQRMFPEGEVLHAAASVDGRLIAVLHRREDDRSVGIFVLRLGLDGGLSEERRPRSVPAQADAVAVSDDGSKIAAGGLDGWVRVWRTGQRNPVSKWRWGADPGDGWGPSRLDFSARGDLLLHVVSDGGSDACSDEDVKHSFYIRDVPGRSQRTVPDGFFDGDDCVSDVALPAEGGPDQVSAVTWKEVGTEEEPAQEYRLKSAALSNSVDQMTQGSDVLDGVVLGIGGRATARLPSGGRAWVLSAAGSVGHESKADLGREGMDEMDTSGRFVVMRDAEISAADGDHDAMPLVLEDSRTGKRYSTTVPIGMDAGLVTVVPRTGRQTPLVLVLQGRDVLMFSTLPTEYPVISRLTELEGVARGSSGQPLVELVSGEPTSDGDIPYALLSRMGGKAHEKQLHQDQGTAEVVASVDGRHVVAWDSDGWQLWTAPDLDYVTGRSSPTDKNGEIIEERALEISSVQPLGQADFLLLGRTGLSRLYGADGRLVRLAEPDCPVDTLSNPRFCLAAAERPGGKGEIVILRRDGQAELWSPKTGHQSPKASLGWMEAGDLVFGPEGEVAALTTDDEVMLWWPGTDRSKTLATGTRAVGPFRADGRTLVLARRSTSERRDKESLELWDTKRAELVSPLHLWSPWDTLRFGQDTISAESELGWVTLSLGPLRGHPDGLCDVLADYPVEDVGDLLNAAEKVSDDADTGPPCRPE